MMANERVNEDEAEAILSNLKMEGRSSVLRCYRELTLKPLLSPGYTVEAWS